MPLRAALALAVLLLAPPAASRHDDDAKRLDRQPRVEAQALRTAVPPQGSRIRAGSGPLFQAQGVHLFAWLPLSTFGSHANANDCWGYTSPSGREYALIGLSGGTAFVEITQPDDPKVVAVKPGPGSLWRGLKVVGDHAYAVSEGGVGIQVFDLAQIDAGTVAYLGNVLAGGDQATHTVAVDAQSGFLYRAGGGGNGLRIYDLNASPTSPPFVGSWSTKYVHEAQVVTYTSGPLAGRQIAYCCSGFNNGWTQTGLTILDVTNKAAVSVLKEVFWPNAGYSHQCWLSDDRQYLYLNDELDEDGTFPTTTYVFDVSSPASAALIGSFHNGNTAVSHNLYVRGNLVLRSDYRSGLRVFDRADPVQPVEVGWFDTYPADDLAHFNGLWSNYPFFPSGLVIGSDIERGLFVWWVGTKLVDVRVPQGAPEILSPQGASVGVEIVESAPGQLAGGTAQLHYDAGAGLQSASLVHVSGNQWRADFPALPCGALVAWFVSAESANGWVWTWPEGGASAASASQVAWGDVVLAAHDMEAPQGWSAGFPGDNAASGIWTRVDPIGSQAQPEDDHSPAPGSQCWVTGQGWVGAGAGDHDVDGGVTTLVGPTFDLSGASDPWISYWRWFSNDQGGGTEDDAFEVEVSSSGGPWARVETVGPQGPERSGGWFFHEFRVGDFVAASSAVRLRFRAQDTGFTSVVEAAIDDLRVRDVDCSGLPDVYCTAKPSSQGCLGALASLGTPSASSAAPFQVTAAGALAQKNAVFFYGFGRNDAPFLGGTLCVEPPIRRTGVQSTGGAPPCGGSLSMDFNAWIQSGVDPALVAGAYTCMQGWFRDPADPQGFGSALTDALSFVIQP